jgi:ABC-2 type transport system permease protein
MNLTYLRYELVRTFRNRRYFFLAVGFPVVLYFVIAAPNRNEHDLAGTGLSAPLYFMVGLAAFGTMSAVVSSGGRIAAERSAGWNRQLRLTPLTTRNYFRAKVATAYAGAIVTLVLLYIAGSALGVRLTASEWARMTGFILVGLIPFAVLGILIGHLLTADSVGPAIGGIVAVFAILGGTWFPVSGVMHTIAEGLPSFWVVQASHVALGGSAWTTTGWVVIAGWTVVLAALARWAYRRDTKRA